MPQMYSRYAKYTQLPSKYKQIPCMWNTLEYSETHIQIHDQDTMDTVNTARYISNTMRYHAL